MKQASDGPLKDILGYTEGQVVSPDFNSDIYTFTFNAEDGIALTTTMSSSFPGMTMNLVTAIGW